MRKFLIISIIIITVSIISFIVFIPIETTSYTDYENLVPQQVQITKPLEYAVTEGRGNSGIPYISVKNTDTKDGNFKVLLWGIDDAKTIYQSYRYSSIYLDDRTPAASRVSFNDFINNLPPENKIEGVIRVQPQQERIVYFPKTDDEWAYQEDAYAWDFTVQSLTMKEVMETRLKPQKIYTKVAILSYWTGVDPTPKKVDYSGILIATGTMFFLLLAFHLTRNIK